MRDASSGGTRVIPTGVGVAGTETRRQRGRHRRARGDWWRELLWPGTTTALTVRQALGQWQRERTCPYPPQYPRYPTRVPGALPPPAPPVAEVR
jgi:hypothetical protein